MAKLPYSLGSNIQPMRGLRITGGSGSSAHATGFGGVISFADTEGFGVLRDLLGHFTTYQRESRQLNEELAKAGQRFLVRRTVNNLVRPRVSTGKLRFVYGSPENIQYDQFGFGLGIRSWMDRSRARYWRIIEQGSAVAAPNWVGPMLDRQGVPLWGGWSAKQAGGETGHPKVIGPYTRYGSGTEQNLAVLPFRLREKDWASGKEHGSFKIPYRAKPVVPHNDYQVTWTGFYRSGQLILDSQLGLFARVMLNGAKISGNTPWVAPYSIRG